MLPGPTIIRKCSACGKLIEEHTISSGNTFGTCYSFTQGGTRLLAHTGTHLLAQIQNPLPRLKWRVILVEQETAT